MLDITLQLGRGSTTLILGFVGVLAISLVLGVIAFWIAKRYELFYRETNQPLWISNGHFLRILDSQRFMSTPQLYFIRLFSPY